MATLLSGIYNKRQLRTGFLVLSLFVALSSKAQHFDPANTSWFDENWNPVPDSLAFYTRYVSGNSTFDYFPDGNLYQVTEYLDSAHRQKHGAYLRYHRGGTKAEEGTYAYGKRSGEWLLWDEKEHLLTRGYYDEQGKRSGEWTYYSKDERYSYRAPGRDSSGTFVDDLRSGDWVYYYDGDTCAVARYENGRRVSVRCMEIDLEFVPDIPCTNQDARYSEGRKAWKKALAKDLIVPKSLKKQNIRRTVHVSFIVFDDGAIGDIRVDQSVHPELDAIAVEFIENASWYPAIRNNRPVTSRITVEIPFR